MLSSEMTHVFSGGCAYEFFENANRYGLVKEEDDGTLTKLPDFENLRFSIKESVETPRTDDQWASDRLTTVRAPSFPPTNVNWQATSAIPPCPLDWSVVEQQIEFEKEWIVIDDYPQTGGVVTEGLSQQQPHEMIASDVAKLSIHN